MIHFGVDAAFPFSIQSALFRSELGWEWLGMYVGGPRAMSRDAWHETANRYPVRDLQPAFNGFMPIYVGRNVGDDPNRPWDALAAFTFEQGVIDGDEATVLTGACGFDRETPLCLDIEYNTWEQHPQATARYVAGWVSVVNAAGHKAGIYADRATVTALGRPELVDFVWCAYWRSRATGLQQAPVGDYDPSWPPPWNIWQFGGSVIAGVSVDLNSLGEGLALATYG